MYLSNISLIFLQTNKKNVVCLPACLPALAPAACFIFYHSPVKSVGNKYMHLIMNVFYEQSTKIERFNICKLRVVQNTIQSKLLK